MKTFNLCFIGFGNVGQNLAKLLAAKRAVLCRDHGIEYRLTGVATQRMGWLAAAEGFDLNQLIKDGRPPTNVRSQASVQEWLGIAKADVLFEMSSLNVENGQPAVDYIRAAFEVGAHVVTANKGPVVHAYFQLRDLAAARGKKFLFEATFMGGVPIFSLFRETRTVSEIRKFRGILNNTTSIILETIEQGGSFEDGVRKAQALGVAETDPSADIDGWDAAVKVASLATVLMNVPVQASEVVRQGIRDIDPARVRAAFNSGRRIRLVSRAERLANEVVATVEPEELPLNDPMASIGSLSLLASFETDTIPSLTISADGLGADSTAYDMLTDFITIARSERKE